MHSFHETARNLVDSTDNFQRTYQACHNQEEEAKRRLYEAKQESQREIAKANHDYFRSMAAINLRAIKESEKRARISALENECHEKIQSIQRSEKELTLKFLNTSIALDEMEIKNSTNPNILKEIQAKRKALQENTEQERVIFTNQRNAINVEYEFKIEQIKQIKIIITKQEIEKFALEEEQKENENENENKVRLKALAAEQAKLDNILHELDQNIQRIQASTYGSDEDRDTKLSMLNKLKTDLNITNISQTLEKFKVDHWDTITKQRRTGIFSLFNPSKTSTQVFIEKYTCANRL